MRSLYPYAVRHTWHIIGNRNNTKSRSALKYSIPWNTSHEYLYVSVRAQKVISNVNYCCSRVELTIAGHFGSVGVVS